VIGFESTPTGIFSDIFVYDIANNMFYQVTSTPAFGEQLTNVSVLGNGDIRIVWAANDGVTGDFNVHGTTFTPLPPPPGFTQVSSGYVHTCGFRPNGVVECWGNNALGQAPPTRTASSGVFTSVGAATFNTCGLTDAGRGRMLGGESLRPGAGSAPRADRYVYSGERGPRPHMCPENRRRGGVLGLECLWAGSGHTLR
jgi:hypothetical protein